MEMSWKEDILLDSEWGLDLPFHQESGLFGDLKSESHEDGTDLSFQAQDAVQTSALGDTISDEDGLATEWMESPDLLTQFYLGSYDAKLVPVDSSLHEFTTLIAPEQAVIVDQGSVNTDLGDVNSSSFVLSDAPVSADIPFDALVSPPGSPEQVAPIIQLQSYSTPVIKAETDICAPLSDSLVDDISSSLLDSIGEFDFNVSHVDEESFIYLDGVTAATELINSPLSADDVDSMLSVSEPASPTSPSHDKIGNIIESSPELYKVIATSSLEVSARFSPYQKSRPVKKEPKQSPKRRAPAQPVPEHIIVGQVNKKDRKKLQNKNAAIRYRQKKKEEAKGIKSEEQELEEYNSRLKTKVDDLEREIRYMKNLMEDVCRAKGLL